MKPWLGSIQGSVPNGVTEMGIKNANAMPNKEICLEHVYGYRTNVRNNGALVEADGGRYFVYFSASVGIVHEVATNMQFYYKMHKEDIVSMAVDRDRCVAATGGIGSKFGILCVWKISFQERQCTHLTSLTGVLEYAVTSCAFSPNGIHLAAIGDDENHTVAIYDWKHATVLCTLATPGRNSIYNLAWLTRSFSDNALNNEECGFSVLNPNHHFVTVGHKHIYVWSIVAKQLHRHKAKLLPHSVPGHKMDTRLSALANISFSMVTFSLQHIVAAGSSGCVYLFKVMRPESKKGVKTTEFLLKNIVLDHVFSAQPALTKPILKERRAMIDYINDCMTAQKALLETGLVTEMHDFLALLTEGKTLDEDPNGFVQNASEQFSEAQRLHQILQGKVEVGTLDSYMQCFGGALDSVTELKAMTEDVWIDLITERIPASPRRVSKIEKKVDPVYRRLERFTKKHINEVTAKDGGLLSSDAFQLIKYDWDSVLRPAAAARIALLNHHRSTTQKAQSTNISTKKRSVAPNRYTGCICLDIHAARYLITGGQHGDLMYFDLYPDISPTEWKPLLSSSPCVLPYPKPKAPVWTVNMNSMDLSTIAASSPSNSIRCVSLSRSSGIAMVGGISGVFEVFFDDKVGFIRQEITGHHGDLRAHLREVRPAPEGYGELWGMERHPSKPQFASCTEDKTLRVWDADLKLLLKRKELAVPAWKCSYSASGAYLAVGFKNGCFAVYLTGSLRRVYPVASASLLTSRFRTARVEVVKFSPDERFLAVGSFNFLDIYKFSGTEVTYHGTCAGASSPIRHADWSADSTLLQCVNKSYELLFYDLTCKVGWRISQVTHSRSLADVEWATHSCPLGWGVQGIFSKFMDGTDVNACARSPDMTMLAVGNDNYAIELYNYPCIGSGYDTRGKLKYRPQKRQFYGHSSHVTGVSWSSDGTRLFSCGGNDLCIFQWNVVDLPDADADADTVPEAGTTGVHPSVRRGGGGGGSPRAYTFPTSPAMPQPRKDSKERKKSKEGEKEAKREAFSKDIKRPHTRTWAAQHKGSVSRGTACYRVRLEASLRRRESIARRRKADSNVYRNPNAETYPGARPKERDDGGDD